MRQAQDGDFLQGDVADGLLQLIAIGGPVVVIGWRHDRFASPLFWPLSGQGDAKKSTDAAPLPAREQARKEGSGTAARRPRLVPAVGSRSQGDPPLVRSRKMLHTKAQHRRASGSLAAEVVRQDTPEAAKIPQLLPTPIIGLSAVSLLWLSISLGANFFKKKEPSRRRARALDPGAKPGLAWLGLRRAFVPSLASGFVGLMPSWADGAGSAGG